MAFCYPLVGLYPFRLLQGDFYVYTRRQIQTHERVDGFVGGIDNIHEALVRTHFELVAGRLVDVWRTQHIVTTNARRQRHRSAHYRARTFGCLDDFGGRSEEHTSELQSLICTSYAVFCLKKKKKKL